MAVLAIKGHPTRGRDIIQLLEMLGGRNSNNCTGQYINRIYFMNKYGYIESTDDIKLQLYCATYNLEEFEEKFPYKVGDKVVYKIYGIHSKIKTMLWNKEKEQVFYHLDSNKLFVATADELKPLKEETIKESIDKTNKVIFDTQAQSCDIMNYIIKKDMEEMDIIKPTTEINLNHPCFDEHNEIELIIPNGWKFEQRGNKMFGIRTQYPKTYEECCDILDIYPIYNKPNLCICEWHPETREMHEHYSKLANLSQKDIAFMILRICRDAYWKIAGEQRGLGKAWKPDWSNCLNKCCLLNCENRIVRIAIVSTNTILAFPTEEMRDAFYENFKDLIEQCKELL